MESHQFWALFVVALIAGAAIALAVNNATMTGAFLEILRRPRPPLEQIEIEGRLRPLPPEQIERPIIPVTPFTARGARILDGAREFNDKLAIYGLDDSATYGYLGKWNTAFANIFVACCESYENKFETREEVFTFCLEFVRSAWDSIIDGIPLVGPRGPEIFQPVAANGGRKGPEIFQPVAANGDGRANGPGVDVEVELARECCVTFPDGEEKCCVCPDACPRDCECKGTISGGVKRVRCFCP